MTTTQYITDNSGHKLAVILPIKKYNQMVEELEELEDIKLYDSAKANDNEPSTPIDEAFKMIEQERKKKQVNGLSGYY